MSGWLEVWVAGTGVHSAPVRLHGGAKVRRRGRRARGRRQW